MNSFKNKIIKTVHENKDKFLEGSLVREEYFKLFEKMGPPSKKQSIFKNTPIDFFNDFDYEIYSLDYDPILDKDFSRYSLTDIERCNFIVLINGFFSKEHSRIISKGIEVTNLSEKVKNDYFSIDKYYITYSEQHEYVISALNAALSRDGLFLRIKPNVVVEEPIHVLSIITNQNENSLFNQRFLIIAEENAQATIIENLVSESNTKSIVFQIAELHQAQKSTINYYRLNNSSITNENLIVFTGNEFVVEKDAILNRFSINFNSTFSRNRTNAKAVGENAEINFNSFVYVKHDGIADIRTIIENAVSNVKCNQIVKAIADENSRVIFNGKIEISKNAQKVEAHQTSRGILLNDNAEIFCEPKLEIYADDVICSHGTAIGNMDDDLIFYLKSRGISEEEAQKLLLSAFAGEIFDKIHIPELKENLLREFQQVIA